MLSSGWKCHTMQWAILLWFSKALSIAACTALTIATITAAYALAAAPLALTAAARAPATTSETTSSTSETTSSTCNMQVYCGQRRSCCLF